MKFYQKETLASENINAIHPTKKGRGSCKIWQNFPKDKMLSFSLGLKVVQMFTYDTKPEKTSPPNTLQTI